MGIQTLIIGYGNRLRGDDGVGPAAAEIVKSWRMPSVVVLTVQQLLPELIEDMKHSDRILFIDAAMNVSDSAYACYIVEPKKSRRPLGHHETPANLLALLHEVESKTPDAWLLTISAFSFDHGEHLTEVATDNMQGAVAWIHAWLGEPPCTKSA